MSEYSKQDEALEETPMVVTIEAEQAETVVADVVDIQQGGVGAVQADVVSLMQGGIVTAEASTIEVTQGGILVAQGQDVTVNQGGAAVVIADHAQFKDSFVGFVAAQEVSGEAKILFDVRAAVVFGVVAGLVVGLFNLFVGRKR
jgi:hypothetical protein